MLPTSIAQLKYILVHKFVLRLLKKRPHYQKIIQTSNNPDFYTGAWVRRLNIMGEAPHLFSRSQVHQDGLNEFLQC